MQDPIIITGCARSRTSLIMQIFKICGAYLGEVIYKTPANRRGQLENRQIIDKIQKPFLKKHGYDPKGQKPLPPSNFSEIDPDRKANLEQILAKQRFPNDKRLVFKDAKACLDWVAWNYSFPKAIWVIVRRSDNGIIDSCLSPKASFMCVYKTRQDWQSWIDKHKKRFEQIKTNCNAYEIDTDRIVKKDFIKIKHLITNLGYKWKEQAVVNNLS